MIKKISNITDFEINQNQSYTELIFANNYNINENKNYQDHNNMNLDNKRKQKRNIKIKILKMKHKSKINVEQHINDVKNVSLFKGDNALTKKGNKTNTRYVKFIFID